MERLHSAAPETDYKTTRMNEWAQIIETEYPDLLPYRTTLLAHLYQECNAMTFDCAWKVGSAKSDYGWSIGIAQWHIPHRYSAWMKEKGFVYKRDPDYVASVRTAFFEDHPDMRDHFGQIHKYLNEQSDCLRDKKDIPHCIRLWNWNDKEYYSNVYSKRGKVLAYLSRQ